MQQIIQAPLSQLFPKPTLREPSESAVLSMAASLEAIDQLSPIGAIKAIDGLEIVYGNTRYLAAMHLGWDSLEARIYPADTSPAACLRISFSENNIREQMTFLQLADALHEYAGLRNITVAAAGRELSYRQSHVSKCLKTDERLTPRNKKKLIALGLADLWRILFRKKSKTKTIWSTRSSLRNGAASKLSSTFVRSKYAPNVLPLKTKA